MTDNPPELDAAATDREQALLQAMWDALGILGYDQDGDRSPDATVAGMGIAGFTRMFLTETQQARDDHDEALQGIPPKHADDMAALVRVGQMYLDAVDHDPENDALTLPEAIGVTYVRDAVDRWFKAHPDVEVNPV